jgi:hypothetical protein
MKLCIEKCPEFTAAPQAQTSFSVPPDTPLFLASLIPDHDFQLGCDTEVSRCINKKLEQDGRQLRKHLEAFSAPADDDVRGRARESAELYLWELLEDCASKSTTLSPQEVFNRQRSAGRLLLLV